MSKSLKPHPAAPQKASLQVAVQQWLTGVEDDDHLSRETKRRRNAAFAFDFEDPEPTTEQKRHRRKRPQASAQGVETVAQRSPEAPARDNLETGDVRGVHHQRNTEATPRQHKDIDNSDGFGFEELSKSGGIHDDSILRHQQRDVQDQSNPLLKPSGGSARTSASRQAAPVQCEFSYAFERRPRRRTRDDHYQLKRNLIDAKIAYGPHDAMKRARRSEKTGLLLTKTYHAPNVLPNRLTVSGTYTD